MDAIADEALLAEVHALDTRIVAAARGLRLLATISWPRHLQAEFVAAWEHGHHRLPRVE
jgi:hypothetical protein